MGCLKWKADPSQECPNYKHAYAKNGKIIPCEYRKRQCLGDNFCAWEPRSISQKEIVVQKLNDKEKTP